MDYGRSSQYRSQIQNSRVGQKQKREDPGDEFIKLSNHEIAGCINDIGVPFSPDDLLRPQAQQIQRVFECLAELLMNTTRETVEPAMREAAHDVCGEELMDVVPAETRNLMGFYGSLRRLMYECGVQDFCFSDLIRPTHPRLVKIFSYIINFVRFREQQTATIDKHFNILAGTKERIESLHTSNANLSSQLEELHTQRERMSQAHEKYTARNEELKDKLRRLQQQQEQQQIATQSAKTQKDALVNQLHEMAARNVSLRQECDKLRPYAVASGTALQTQLGELRSSLNRDKASLTFAEKRLRALHTSADTFSLASGDVGPVASLLSNLQNDMAAEESEMAEAAKRRDALSERSLNVRAIEREEDLLKSQLRRWSERTDGLRKAAEERSESAGKRMKDLGEEHKRLMSERGEKGREVERRKVRVEQAEKKMADLKENIEIEISSARDEYMKMDAHIRLYITEMEQST